MPKPRTPISRHWQGTHAQTILLYYDRHDYSQSDRLCLSPYPRRMQNDSNASRYIEKRIRKHWPSKLWYLGSQRESDNIISNSQKIVCLIRSPKVSYLQKPQQNNWSSTLIVYQRKRKI